MYASKMMTKMTTTTQKKNTIMPGMECPAMVLALAMAASYPLPPGLLAHAGSARAALARWACARPVEGVAVSIQRRAFGGEAMTAQWRERTIGTPLYQPDLDLVAVAPDGTLAGFCVGWHEPARGLAQLEPVGVHPRYQRRGLSRALLTEMLYRFKGRGASVAIVETEFERTAARAAYDAVGFKQAHTIYRLDAWAIDVR